MAKRPVTRVAKAIQRQKTNEKAGHHKPSRKHNPDAVVSAPGKQKAKAASSGDKSDRARASTSVRGRTTHSLSSSGRKTTARTQGGASRGSGRGHDAW